MLYINRQSRFILVAVLLLVTSMAMAAQTRPTGSWSGALQDDKSNLMATEASFDNKVAHLHFKGAANCKVDADYLKTDADGSHYSFSITKNGGTFCQNLLNKTLVVTTTDSDLILSFLQGAIHWRGELQKD